MFPFTSTQGVFAPRFRRTSIKSPAAKRGSPPQRVRLGGFTSVSPSTEGRRPGFYTTKGVSQAFFVWTAPNKPQSLCECQLNRSLLIQEFCSRQTCGIKGPHWTTLDPQYECIQPVRWYICIITGPLVYSEHIYGWNVNTFLFFTRFSISWCWWCC